MPGFSKKARQQYGPAILSTLEQAHKYAADMQQGLPPRGPFLLDTTGFWRTRKRKSTGAAGKYFPFTAEPVVSAVVL